MQDGGVAEAALLPFVDAWSVDIDAPPDRVLSNRRLLPPGTKFVEIKGGNHSQFGRYGHQLFDGTATVSRDEQEAITRSAILDALAVVSSR
jgi:hypothetical protein